MDGCFFHDFLHIVVGELLIDFLGCLKPKRHDARCHRGCHGGSFHGGIRIGSTIDNEVIIKVRTIVAVIIR